MTIFVASLFLPYTVHFELDSLDAAELCEEPLAELFEPVRKRTLTLDDVKSTTSNSKTNNNLINSSSVTTNANTKTTTTNNNNNNINKSLSTDPISIIQSLANNISSSNLSISQSIDSHPSGFIEPQLDDLSNDQFKTIIDDDLESISSTSSLIDVKGKSNNNTSATINANLHPSPLTSNPNNTNQALSQKTPTNISDQDFFFNNPYKSKMSLSSTSFDDTSIFHTLNNIPHDKSYTLRNHVNSPYGQLQNNTTFVKPKPVIRNITPQCSINEITHKPASSEPKLSSMRVNRPHTSNMRKLRTSSMISLDKKMNLAQTLHEIRQIDTNDSSLSFDKSFNEFYNHDIISDNYTDLLQNEESELFNIENDGKVAPFGGFSKPHKFSEDMENIFNTASWKVLEFDKGNGSLVKSIELAQENNVDNFEWIGTISMPSNIVPEKIKNDISTELSNNYKSNVIFLDDEVFQGHYQSFCKKILWPIFHYQIPDNPKSNAFENHSWKYYEEVNRIFAEKIASVYKENDIVWVHDYHLMLLPQMLRELIPNVKIGFFLHISFPSSEVFRCLAQRKKILEGMLGADCVTFQNDEYMAHFLQSSNRLLLADFNDVGVYYKNKITAVSYNPIGLDFEKLDNQIRSTVVTEWKKLVRDRWPNKKLVVSRDKIDKIRGLKEKLLAYEKFLELHPEYITESILILICIESNSADDDYKDQIFSIAERINSKIKNISTDQPIILLNQDIEFEQYLALLSEADLFIVSTLREGMNLTCHEFICANQEMHSPLILSEFVGSASVLTNGPLISNPYNVNEVANQIYKCLTMSEVEKSERWNNTFKDVLNHDSKTWVNKCIEDINNAFETLSLSQTRVILEPLTKEIYSNALTNAGKNSKRLFILNLDELASNLEIHGQTIHSVQQTLINKTLTNLSSNPNNYVYIFSLSQRTEMQRLYKRVPDIGFIAENGGLIKPPRKSEWFTVIYESEKNWIPTVVDIINAFCERIPGSYIEVEECTVRFHIGSHHGIDKDYKNGLVGDLITHINELFTKDFNVHAGLLNGVLIVQEMNLISRALSFVSEQYINSEQIMRVSSTSSMFNSPVLQASSYPNSPVIQASLNSYFPDTSSPLQRSASINSTFSNLVDNSIDFVFTCGSANLVDDAIFSHFNEMSMNMNINSISVCVGKTGKCRTSAKYSLTGINNLMTLLD